MTDQEQPDRDPYEPEINDRGMAYMPALDGIGGEAVRVHDSSLAGTDAVWLYIDTTAGDKTGAQLPFTEAFKLASQIYTLAERRGYPVPVPVVPRTRRDVKLGDPVHITNPDGSSYTATIRTISEDGTFTAVGNAPESAPTEVTTLHVLEPGLLEFDPEEMPAPGDIINCHLGENTYTVRFHAVREDGSAVIESIDESDISGLVTGHTDPLHARHYTPRGYPYDTWGTTPGASNASIPDGPRPLAVILNEDITGIDNSLNRTRHDVATLADRLEYLERCYREVPRPQDVGVMSAHLAKIERLESELAEARREINAHKDVLGQVGAEKRKLEAQLEAHHQHDADPRRAVDIVKVNRDLTRQLHEAQRELGGMRDRERAVDTVIESVVDGKIRLAEWVDPETPAGRVYELIATLLRQAHDAERQGDAGALENVEAAVTTYERGDNPLDIGLPDGTLAVRIALALHNNRQRIAELEREMTAITDHLADVADVAGGDDDDTPLTRVRAAVDNLGARARIEGIAEFVERQATEYRKHSAQAVDEDRALAVRMGVPPSRFLSDGELSERESDAATTIIKAGGEFTASVEGAVATAEREADTDE